MSSYLAVYRRHGSLSWTTTTEPDATQAKRKMLSLLASYCELVDIVPMEGKTYIDVVAEIREQHTSFQSQI